jgi:hypothetical protein
VPVRPKFARVPAAAVVAVDDELRRRRRRPGQQAQRGDGRPDGRTSGTGRGGRRGWGCLAHREQARLPRGRGRRPRVVDLDPVEHRDVHQRVLSLPGARGHAERQLEPPADDVARGDVGQGHQVSLLGVAPLGRAAHDAVEADLDHVVLRLGGRARGGLRPAAELDPHPHGAAGGRVEVDELQRLLERLGVDLRELRPVPELLLLPLVARQAQQDEVLLQVQAPLERQRRARLHPRERRHASLHPGGSRGGRRQHVDVAARVLVEVRGLAWQDLADELDPVALAEDAVPPVLHVDGDRLPLVREPQRRAGQGLLRACADQVVVGHPVDARVRQGDPVRGRLRRMADARARRAQAAAPVGRNVNRRSRSRAIA